MTLYLTHEEARAALAALEQMVLEYAANPAELTAITKLKAFLGDDE